MAETVGRRSGQQGDATLYTGTGMHAVRLSLGAEIHPRKPLKSRRKKPSADSRHDSIKRCDARMPKRVRGIWPGGRCGLWKGHDGNHTLLIPSWMPWFDGAKRKDPASLGERRR